MLKKVLTIEDNEDMQLAWHMVLDEYVELISAFSIKEAEEKFAVNPDIAAVVMDACVPGSVPTTIPLVQKIRQTFSGPMIAVSNIEEFQRELIKAGCNYKTTKFDMPEKLLEVLGL